MSRTFCILLPFFSLFNIPVNHTSYSLLLWSPLGLQVPESQTPYLTCHISLGPWNLSLCSFQIIIALFFLPPQWGCHSSHKGHLPACWSWLPDALLWIFAYSFLTNCKHKETDRLKENNKLPYTDTQYGGCVSTEPMNIGRRMRSIE